MIKIKDTNINYILYGEKKKTTIVLLHGWGQNIEMMKMIGDAFKDRFQILILDLPGYGKSSEPPFSWSVYDYVDMLHELLSKLNIKDIILIGHSFGGKISLAYSSKYDVKKLVLFGSPFKPEIEKISFKTKI